jgi:hypothetical protein
LVIEQVFFGTSSVPRAQYVMLRTLASGQIFVSGQQFKTQHADASEAPLFGTFTKIFGAHPGPDVAMIAATKEAQDLFCLPMDEVVSGSLIFPDGRVCFGLFDYGDGLGARPVDCVAYGAFTGSNEPYLPAAMAPELGLALVRVDETDNNQNDFALLPPMPQNNPGGVGAIDGTPGDVDGSGSVAPQDLEDLSRLVFAATKRCQLGELPAPRADLRVDRELRHPVQEGRERLLLLRGRRRDKGGHSPVQSHFTKLYRSSRGGESMQVRIERGSAKRGISKCY